MKVSLPKEKIIEGEFLVQNLNDCIKMITEDNNTLLIYSSLNIEKNHYNFVLGSETVCGYIIGLIDEEYGWPKSINIKDIKKISDIKPSYRKHPYIVDETKLLAISIQYSEYKIIKEKFFSEK